VLIWREFGVLYKRHDVCTLLHNLGFSCQNLNIYSFNRRGACLPQTTFYPC